MDAHQTNLELATEPAGHPLATTPCSPSGGDVHAALITLAAAWLRKKGCAVVITDMTHGGPETADAIGWRGNYSMLVECKASRSDFLADRKKDFRRNPERGMGSLRYFCAPAGLIRADELPPCWGLLESTNGKLRESVKATHQKACERYEVGLLLSALRRVAHKAPKGISVRCYTFETKSRASLGVANSYSMTSRDVKRPVVFHCGKFLSFRDYHMTGRFPTRWKMSEAL